MTSTDVEIAASSSFEAWKSWKRTLASDRSKILRRMSLLMKENIDDLAYIMTLESGKPLSEAKGEVNYARSFYDYYAEEAVRIKGDMMESSFKGQKMFTIKQSIGPAALITPWNFPQAMITRKVSAALAAGCTVVIKPSEETPLSALALCAIAEEAGVPKGVINCLTVSREEVQEVGLALCHNDLIRKISFTGSTNIGKWLMRESASTVKRTSMELGGNAPFIVFEDADLQVAVKALIATKFRNAGQACIASNRILVHEKIYEKFSNMLAEKVAKMKIGNGLENGTSIGPLINAQALAKITRHVEESVALGAKLLVGGPVDPKINEKGAFFYNPTVLTNMTLEMTPMIEESFGPICPILMFKTEEEAINIANSTKFGLAGYACTNDMSRTFRLTEALEFGMIGINGANLSSASTPFGGVKESGIGREGGHWGLDEYLEVKYVGVGYVNN
eukprot:CAMPEP_0119043564 /NCGR_PEP_ID=MMETSP1177-20130426/23398_1 /TAXON_ID=2985 /ORGANISM="Ochromonas sp, Strain CCMP1899" /LENGTH=448 /DNA_ID=CAMNT_0007011917 /DNA_START=303 /DNA_END=1649 /DNA_ORIENTATION=+